MRLLIDAGNTRLKWQLIDRVNVVAGGACPFDSPQWLDQLAPYRARIDRIAVSTVISEAKRTELVRRLALLSAVEVRFYWSESFRSGLKNAYSDVSKMGADRWHAMYGAWSRAKAGFTVIDAGSAITIDYVADNGAHLGGYILPGKQMMLHSLRQQAARIGFELVDVSSGDPGKSTTECVQHGINWLWKGVVRQLIADCQKCSFDRILCTGGDADALVCAGLPAQHDPDLVLAGLSAIDAESVIS